MSENNFFEITSLNNETVKNVVKLQQKKYRKECGLIFLEGEKSLTGALEANVKLKSIFYLDEKNISAFKNLDSVDFYKVNEKVMDKIATVKSASNIAAVALEPKYSLDEILKYDKLVLLDNIKDAGNLGTIIRSACAFGVDGILLYGQCVDEFSSKVIRSSAGNIFKIPIVHLGGDISVMQKIKKTHKIISTVAPFGEFGKKAHDCQKIDYPKKHALALGSEACGLCKEILSISDDFVTLKIENNVESLNLAIFAGIIFYIINSKK